jgi:ABC-type glycerol-3-phosphate transport system substrate-binding protein
VLAAGAATVATTFLSACGGQTGTSDVKTLGPVTVRFTPANGPGGDVQAFEPLLPQYMQERPNVKVELEVIADGGWTKVNALLMADSAADVMRVNDDSVYQWGSTGKFTHLDPFINKSMKRDDYFPPEWKDMLVDGKQYSMQPHFGVNLFVYSTALFKKAGISAPTDWNKTWDWQTFVDACRKIATPNAAPGQEVYAVTFPANYVVPLVWGNGGRQYNADETKCVFNSKEAAEILQEVQDLTWVQRLFVYGQNAAQLFTAGRLAMNWGDPGFGTRLPPEVPWDLMPTPKSKKEVYQEGYVRTFAIPTSAKNVDASWDLMRWLMQQQAQVHLGQAGYGVPALKAAADPTFKDGPLKDKNWKLIPEGLNHDVPLANNPIGQTFKDQYTKGPADQFLLNQMPTREMLDSGCQEVDNKIRELNWKKKG